MPTFERNLGMGNRWEIEVGEYLANKGYDVEYYVSYDENGNQIGQRIEINGKYYAHPDFIVEIRKTSGLFRKMLVEVKSVSKFYNNYGRLDYRTFPAYTSFAVIEAHKFTDYWNIAQITGLETRVIFISEQNPYPWYWERLDWLSNNAKMAKYAYSYNEYDLHYMWDIATLQTMNHK
jgi:hypothetical protein